MEELVKPNKETVSFEEEDITTLPGSEDDLDAEYAAVRGQQKHREPQKSEHWLKMKGKPPHLGTYWILLFGWSLFYYPIGDFGSVELCYSKCRLFSWLTF